MIFDFLADPQQEYQADICIIGSGAAGLALAQEFFDTNLQVLIIERGNEEVENKLQSINKASITGHQFRGDTEGRVAAFGGATTKWGGQALPFTEIDFEQRDWINKSGWPIDYQDFKGYIDRADRFLKVKEIPYQKSVFELAGAKEILLERDLILQFSKWCPQPNLKEIYRSQFQNSSHVNLLLNGHVKELILSESHQEIVEVSVINSVKRQAKIKAKKYILAGGSLENARLLLMSNKQLQGGIGNKNGLVGTFFQDHPINEIGTVIPKNNKTFQQYFNYFFLDKTRIFPRLITSSNWQKNNKTLGASAYFNFSTTDNDAFDQAKHIYRNIVRRNFGQIKPSNFVSLAKNIPILATVLFHYLVHKKVYQPNAKIRLQVMLEQEPNSESKVFLTHKYDDFGLPILAINWQLSPLVGHTLIKFVELLELQFKTMGIGTLTLDSWIKDYPEKWPENLFDSLHQMGTTRMGANENIGVVDGDCKVFNVSNLYISGSSVFPTSGSSNPTLTLIALAKRLADHLKTILK